MSEAEIMHYDHEVREEFEDNIPMFISFCAFIIILILIIYYYAYLI